MPLPSSSSRASSELGVFTLRRRRYSVNTGAPVSLPSLMHVKFCGLGIAARSASDGGRSAHREMRDRNPLGENVARAARFRERRRLRGSCVALEIHHGLHPSSGCRAMRFGADADGSHRPMSAIRDAKKPRRSGVWMAVFFFLITRRFVAFYADPTLFYWRLVRFCVDRTFAD